MKIFGPLLSLSLNQREYKGKTREESPERLFKWRFDTLKSSFWFSVETYTLSPVSFTLFLFFLLCEPVTTTLLPSCPLLHSLHVHSLQSSFYPLHPLVVLSIVIITVKPLLLVTYFVWLFRLLHGCYLSVGQSSFISVSSTKYSVESCVTDWFFRRVQSPPLYWVWVWKSPGLEPSMEYSLPHHWFSLRETKLISSSLYGLKHTLSYTNSRLIKIWVFVLHNPNQ